MSRQDPFDHVLASLHEAMLDDAHWPQAAALIDQACGIKGHCLVLGDRSPGGDVQIFMARFFHRGERRRDWERLYYRDYHARDERAPRLSRLPDSRIVHVNDLYTEEEARVSPVYNEALVRSESRNGLNVRLDGPEGTNIVWTTADPVAPDGWGSAQVELIRRLLPHVRQFASVRQALAEASALAASRSDLLNITRVGVICLDRRGRIVEVNDAARKALLGGKGLHDRGGFLGAWRPAEDARLQRLLAEALPPFGSQGVSGSTTVGRSQGLSSLVLHAVPIGDRQADFRTRRVAAMVLVVDPLMPPRIDATLVAAALGLTPVESQVATMVAEGRTVSDMASATRRGKSTVYRHLRQVYRKLGISRQVDVARLVLSLFESPESPGREEATRRPGASSRGG